MILSSIPQAGPVYGFPGWIIPWVALSPAIWNEPRQPSWPRKQFCRCSPPHQVGTLALAVLALLAVLREDVEAAKDQYPALESYRGISVPSEFNSFDRLLGLLSFTMGDLEQATTHFEDTLTFCHNTGYMPTLAWTCCDYTDTLLQRASTSSAQAHPADREQAMCLLDKSLAIPTELGMRPIMERVLSLRDMLKA